MYFPSYPNAILYIYGFDVCNAISVLCIISFKTHMKFDTHLNEPLLNLIAAYITLNILIVHYHLSTNKTLPFF